MALTISELFGSNAVLNSATPSLLIALTDFLSESLNGTAGYTASKIGAALVRKWLSSTKDKTEDSTAGITVSEPYVSLTTRNGETQRAYAYTVTIYVPDQGTVYPDPDLVP